MIEVLFWLSIFMLGYTFVGYPILLHLVAHFSHTKPPADNTEVPTVEVILVVRNAEQIITQKIDSLLALDYPKEKLKILIISDFSTDKTVDVLDQLKHSQIRWVDNQQKSSKSACVNQGVAMSEAEILFLTDIRQPIEKSALRHLIKHFNDENIGAVSGELIFRNKDGGDFSEGMDAYWRYEKFIRRNESIIGSVPGVTGAIYALRRTDFKPIPDETLLDDVLIPMDLVLKGKRVLFESKAIAYDTPSSDAAKEKIRKTRTLAGNWQLLVFRPALLNPFKNSIWIQYLSHKVFRLFAPLFLLMLFMSSFHLESTHEIYKLSFYAQLLVYISVVLATAIPALMNIKLIRIAHSFLMLMVFTVNGFWAFITGKHLTIWK